MLLTPQTALMIWISTAFGMVLCWSSVALIIRLAQRPLDFRSWVAYGFLIGGLFIGPQAIRITIDTIFGTTTSNVVDPIMLILVVFGYMAILPGIAYITLKCHLPNK
jgi:hypothetical protein